MFLWKCCQNQTLFAIQLNVYKTTKMSIIMKVLILFSAAYMHVPQFTFVFTLKLLTCMVKKLFVLHWKG